MSHAVDQQIAAMLEDMRNERSFLYIPAGRLNENARRRVKSGALICPVAGIYADAATWGILNPADRARYTMRALTKREPKIQFCSYSAALLYGLEVHYSKAFPLQATSLRYLRTPNSRNVRRSTMSFPACQAIDNIRVTTIEDTLFDCLKNDELKFGLGPLDSALRMGLVEKDTLPDHFRLFDRYRKGVRNAIAIAQMGDGKATNGGESYARAVIYELGFKMPELQVPIENPLEPGKYFYADFGWRQNGKLMALGELDGVEKYLNPDMTGGQQPFEVMRRERLRESLITLAGCPVVRFSFGMLDDPQRMTKLLDAYGVPRRHDP